MKNIGKPCAGKLHARFDEGGQAQCLLSTLPWHLTWHLTFSEMHGYPRTRQLATAIQGTKVRLEQHPRFTSLKDTSTLRCCASHRSACNVSVVCNTPFLADYRRGHCPLSFKPSFYHHNMDECFHLPLRHRSVGIDLVIPQKIMYSRSEHFAPARPEWCAVIDVSEEDASTAECPLK